VPSMTAKPSAARFAAALLVLFAGTSASAGAQEAGSAATEPILSTVALPSTGGPWRTSAADSARILSGARSAQARFELIRRNNLPWTWDRGSGPCDERIGRFCLWHSDGESRWQPPPDPERVVAARGVLVARLDMAAAVIPGDWWVAGQRVRYLLEAGQTEDALAAARACRSAEPGWCDALLGYVLHGSGEYVRSDSVFQAALAAMPPAERERWTDLSPLLEPDAVRGYRRLGPAERADFEARFWWLAEPLYMLPGNDRRTEHLSRLVTDRLQDRARQTEGISWGSDLRELLLRYGTPAGWERIRPRSLHTSEGSILTRYPPGSRFFDPVQQHLRDPHRITPDGWDLKPRRSRTSYAPAYAAPVEELDYQLGVLQRGDSSIVVAALRLQPDSLDHRPPADAALVVWPDFGAEPWLARGQVTGERPAVLALTVPAEPAVLSVEALAREERRAARARFGRPLRPLPAHGLAVSDLLLLEESDSLPDILDDALPLLRASTTARSGERLGLFWEIYGLAAGDLPVHVAVQLLDDNAGWLRRTAIRAGLTRQQTPLTVRWQEAPQRPDAVHPRSLVVELPELSPGRYTLQLTLTPRGRDALGTERTITVVE
jgi:hypothetical protein